MKVIQVVFVVITASLISCISDNAGSGRITGGWNAFAAQLPFVASVHHNGEFLCSGVIVNETWILTSATCISDIPATPEIVVKVGGIQHSLNPIESGSLNINVESTHFHWGFDASLPQNIYEYNLALLKLVSPILSGSPLMSPIVMARTAVPAGTRLYLAGWGGVSNSLPVDKLQYSDQVTVMDIMDCSNHIGMFLNDDYICTMPYPMHTACHFDEGGPLFSVDPAAGFRLLGIVSYASCTSLNVPTIYSSVYSWNHKLWIGKLIGTQENGKRL